MKDVDWFSWLVIREDAEGVGGARDHVTPELLHDLLRLYERLGPSTTAATVQLVDGVARFHRG